MKKFLCGFSAGVLVGGAISYLIGSLYKEARNERLDVLEEELNNFEKENIHLEDDMFSADS